MRGVETEGMERVEEGELERVGAEKEPPLEAAVGSMVKLSKEDPEEFERAMQELARAPWEKSKLERGPPRTSEPLEQELKGRGGVTLGGKESEMVE